PGELATELPALDRALSARVTQRAEDGDAAVTVANALHLANRGDLVAEAYRELLRTQFDAELFTGSDLAAINGWVSDRTQGRIDRILESLDPLSVAVLLNAVHFKAGWAHPFRANATAPAPFHLSGGETVDVPTMQVTASFPLVTGADFDAIMLPYAGERLAMVVFSPAPAGGDGLSVETVRGTIDALVGADAKRLRLSMPKFKSEFGADLVPAFAAMGLTLPFDGGRADFAGMIDSKEEKDRVHITQIRHKAFIEVDENGTEAAASTAVELAIRSVAPPADDFRIDRPFTYMIVDRASGAILFVGRLSDPRPQAAQ
ncbi:MAG: serpin family protein, partial [Pseudomonadota bacterium]|nr:serpin family protein [Pseudomonadota bacterium]